MDNNSGFKIVILHALSITYDKFILKFVSFMDLSEVKTAVLDVGSPLTH